jgi:hypothetical protein
MSADVDESDCEEIRALRDQILDCCKGHNGGICVQALVEALINGIDRSACNADVAREAFKQVIECLECAEMALAFARAGGDRDDPEPLR